jgi:hypothetical protein
MGEFVVKNNQSEEFKSTDRDIRKTNIRIDTLIIEIEHNIAKTKKEVEERNKIREDKERRNKE